MWSNFFVVSLVVIALYCAPVLSQCSPGTNCKTPDCRCWNDPNNPGGLTTAEVPQIVMVSFAYGINNGNVDSYRQLFDGITNPNGCQAKGTFFVSELNTDFSVVNGLYTEKHEIGITTPTATIPLDGTQWKLAFADMRAKLAGAGIPLDAIKGTRGPELFIGGNEQFDSIEDNDLLYDSTCVSLEYVERSNLIWPYTYDYTDKTPACTIGTTPTKGYPGKWQFLVADISYKGTKCAVPSSCSPLIQDAKGAFDFFYDAFEQHYNGATRAPFIMFVDPGWLSVDYQKQGTKQFLDFIRAAYDDTWIITTQQALAWIKDPVPAKDAASFKPWDCK